jgi:methionine synthase II (cobalamin-independent)
VAEQVLRWLDMLGLAPDELGNRLSLSPSCGLGGASYAWARKALTTLRKASARLTDQP